MSQSVFERTFSDVTICMFKLRNFDSKYRCNATEASAWVYYMPTVLCYNCIISYSIGVSYHNITWRGLACVAYPYLGAMRRPEHRDRRGGTNSHVFFYFHNLTDLLTLNLGSS